MNAKEHTMDADKRLLTYILVGLLLALIFMLKMMPKADVDNAVIIPLLLILGGELKTIYGYVFGSSQGAKDAQAVISGKLTPSGPDSGSTASINIPPGTRSETRVTTEIHTPAAEAAPVTQ